MEKVSSGLTKVDPNKQEIRAVDAQNISNIQMNIELTPCLNYDENYENWFNKITKNARLGVKILLFSICCYVITPYSDNPKQKEHEHSYSDLGFLYFTNQSLYFTVLTVAIGFIYNFNSKLFELYNTLLPISLTFEIVVTGLFWGLYFIDKKLIVNANFLKPGYETPILTELGLHLFPLILLILDQIDVELRRTKLQSLFMTCYLILWSGLIIILGNIREKYMYPFMNLFTSEILRLTCFLISILIFNIIYRLYIGYKTKKRLIKY